MTSVYGYSQHPFNEGGFYHQPQPQQYQHSQYHPNGYNVSHVRQRSYFTNNSFNNQYTVPNTFQNELGQQSQYQYPPGVASSDLDQYGTYNQQVGGASFQQPVAGVPPSLTLPAPVSSYYAPPQQQVIATDDQNVNGGVSSVLDYDLTTMSKFTTYLAFRLFGRSDTSNVKFVSTLKNVLSAIRLPLSSLILSNYYLLERFEKTPESFENSNDDSIHQCVILSLVLANKANDDNTFTNKSWSSATGLNVRLINSLEASWLALFDWKLHDIQMERYNELHTQFNKYTESVTQQATSTEAVSPISSNSAEFSPRDHSTSRFNSYQNKWSNQNSFDYQPNYYENPRYSSTHNKSYSLQLEPDYCTRTGSYQKTMYCQCHYCSNSIRNVDWSYNLATAC